MRRQNFFLAQVLRLTSVLAALFASFGNADGVHMNSSVKQTRVNSTNRNQYVLFFRGNAKQAYEVRPRSSLPPNVGYVESGGKRIPVARVRLFGTAGGPKSVVLEDDYGRVLKVLDTF